MSNLTLNITDMTAQSTVPMATSSLPKKAERFPREKNSHWMAGMGGGVEKSPKL